MTLAQRIYLAVQNGCPACAEAQHHLHEFRRRHPFVLVIPTHRDAIKDWSPSATPAYALLGEDGRISKRKIGVMDADQLERWLKKPIRHDPEEADEGEDNDDEDDDGDEEN